jgi:hypothetical protein
MLATPRSVRKSSPCLWQTMLTLDLFPHCRFRKDWWRVVSACTLSISCEIGLNLLRKLRA